MSLTEPERARLSALARTMIPGGAGQPGAADLELQGAPADRVLAIDPSRLAPLRRFLAQEGPADSLAAVEALARADPEGFGALSVVLANAYFMHPATRAAIGYPGQEARDSSIGLTDADRDLLAPVIARGPVFRPA
jgi:hypothetical protein